MAFSLLTFKPLEAPDAYYFKDPDTARMFQADTKVQLIQQIVSYRAQNNFEPLEYLGLVIDAYMCSMPKYKHKCMPAEPLSRSIFGYMSGGVALLKNMFYGNSRMVVQKVADARAEQCVTCSNNVFPDKKGFLKWSDQIAEASTHGRKSKHFEELGNCLVCSCPLKAKVWYKCSDETFSAEEIQGFKAVDCWQLKQKD